MLQKRHQRAMNDRNIIEGIYNYLEMDLPLRWHRPASPIIAAVVSCSLCAINIYQHSASFEVLARVIPI